MTGKLITIACIAVTSMAFGQSQTTNSAKSRETDSSTTERRAAPDTAIPATANDVVTVNSFSPGNSIVVSSTPMAHATTYVLGKDVHYTDENGRPVDPNRINSGTRVRLEVTGDDRHVGRVIVIQSQ